LAPCGPCPQALRNTAKVKTTKTGDLRMALTLQLGD
jgi:hypothetical protein